MEVKYNLEITKEDLVQLKIEEHKNQILALQKGMEKEHRKLQKKQRELWKSFTSSLMSAIQEDIAETKSLLEKVNGVKYRLAAVSPVSEMSFGLYFRVDLCPVCFSEKFSSLRSFYDKFYKDGRAFAILNPFDKDDLINYCGVPVKTNVVVDVSSISELLAEFELFFKKWKPSSFIFYAVEPGCQDRPDVKQYWSDYKDKVHNELLRELMKECPPPLPKLSPDIKSLE